MHVLLVDPDLYYLKTLVMMLVACSYRVIACNSAKGALELLEGRNEAFDILITEVHLPDMDGFQLLDCVRYNFSLPVILMSYDGTMISVLRGVQLGASSYML
ncbi:hypothetical protein MLD38_040840 [Melastoma candidum]|nr:hypothetical protein MLD38_040840 [Melastoma candidum]